MAETVDAPELLPVRMVNEFAYCPRLFHLEWVQGEWADNAFTEDGKVVHRRANREGVAPPEPDDQGAPPFVARAVSVSSLRLGLSTRLDVVEGEGGVVAPVEYKRGRPPKVPSRAYDPERVQVCAQALVLRDAGYQVDEGYIYFAGSRERVTVELDEALVRMTEEAIRGAREAAARAEPPPPLVDSPKCDGCSLVAICLPDETNRLRREAEEASATERPLRRLHPANDDAVPLYVQRGGTKLGISHEVLEIKEQGTKVGEARVEHTSHVAIFGGVQVSTQALRALLERDIPVAIFSAGGWFYGWARGLGNRNIELRRAQFRTADDPVKSLEIARRIVSAKVANQRTILRRNLPSAAGADLDRLTALRDDAERAGSAAELLGLEGTAARIYFGRFPELLKNSLGAFDVAGRNRRPPLDPLNALLSFVYSLLAKDLTIVAQLVGFDPYLGLYHRPRFGRPSLALDLMEEFRPIIADSVILNLVNSGSVGADDFLRRGTGVGLKDHARRRVISAYERRMNELVTHPVFGYRISYRRVLEVQTRLLARHLLGEIPSFPAFRTR